MTTSAKTVYLKGELVPLAFEPVADDEITAESASFPHDVLQPDALWVDARPSLDAALVARLDAEVRRRGAACASVIEEHVHPVVKQGSNEARLHGRFGYVLYRAPTSST